MIFVNWLGGKFMEGVTWLLQQGTIGIIKGVGSFSRFMTENCSSSFTLFAVAGFLVVIAGGKEKGIKMVNLSFIVFIIMKVLGGTL